MAENSITEIKVREIIEQAISKEVLVATYKVEFKGDELHFEIAIDNDYRSTDITLTNRTTAEIITQIEWDVARLFRQHREWLVKYHTPKPPQDYSGLKFTNSGNLSEFVIDYLKSFEPNKKDNK